MNKHNMLKYSRTYGVMVINIIMFYMFNEILKGRSISSGSSIVGLVSVAFTTFFLNSISYVALSVAHVLVVLVLTMDLLSAYLNRVLFALYVFLIHGLNSYVALMEASSLLLSIIIVRLIKIAQITLASPIANLTKIQWSKSRRKLEAPELPLILASHSLASSLLFLLFIHVIGFNVLINRALFFIAFNIALPLLLLIVGIIISTSSEISEYELVGFASGLSLMGFVPFLASLSTSENSLFHYDLRKIVYAHAPGLYLGEAEAFLTYGAPRNMYEKLARHGISVKTSEKTWYWRRTRHPIYVRLDELNTPHVIIIGASGSGKTSLAKHIAVSSSKQYGYNLVIIDPHGEYKDIADIAKCRVIDASKHVFNPLYLENTSPRERALQLSHVISTIFKLGLLQRQMLEEIILKAYESKGIIQEDQSTWAKTPPTIDDLVATCRELGEISQEYMRVLPYLILLRENIGSGTLLSIDELFSGNVIIDTSGFSSDFARALFLDTLMYMLINKMYSMKSAKRIQIVFEEARGLMPRKLSRELLSRLFTESRKFGFSIIVISQELHGIPRVLINNAGLRVFFVLNEPKSIEGASRIIAGSDVRDKIQVISEALRALDSHVFILHVTGVETVFVARSPLLPTLSSR
ncbi:MAG: DUF87 domain-containing protein [Desulfurococcaceae archaeon]